MRNLPGSLAIVAACIAIHVLLSWSTREFHELGTLSRDGDVRHMAAWYAYLDPALRALAVALPGLLAGRVAGRDGFVLGAIVGGLAALIESMLFNVRLPIGSFYPAFVLQLVALAVYPAAMGSMAGAAGELLSRGARRAGFAGTV